MYRVILNLLLLALSAYAEDSMDLEQSSLPNYNGKEVFEIDDQPSSELIDYGFETSDVDDKHPRLLSSNGVDRLCSPTNTVDNVCTIYNMTLRFSSDLRYETDKTLVFDNSKLKCLTISYAPCSFEFIQRGKDGS